MKPDSRENLQWVHGLILGVMYSMPEDKKEIKDALRCASRVINDVLHEEKEEEEDSET